MSGFFEEVKRRKVYRVAVAYVVVAGGTIQLASAAFPAWDLPNWALRLVIVLLLLGFPIALILAWAFDVTPEGIRATPRLESARPSHRRRNIAVLCAVGLFVSAVAGFFLLPRASAKKLDKSIAVLPFENFSGDQENAFFADGIQDDILTNLAKIGDLKVISRTSVMPYRGKTGNVREIGKALGVSTILEGSVRKSGNRIRLNVQLINATNDQHIWAEDYDRDLTDMFAIQTDLAQKIADELQAKLSPTEKAQMTRRPTENGEAYLAFVQANNLFVPEDLEKMKQAEQLYDRALQLDPKFALAMAKYAYLESWLYRTYDRTPARSQKGRALVERALELEPDLPEAHLANGFWLYYGDLNYEAAAREFEIARRGLPNEASAYLALGAIQRRQGRWQESTANLEKAASLSPTETWPLQNLAYNYEMLRDYAAANKTADRALAIAPNSFAMWDLKARLAIEERGDFSIAEKKLAEFAAQPLQKEYRDQLAAARANVAILQRKYDEVLRIVESTPADARVEHGGNYFSRYGVVGAAKLGLHDLQGAREAFSKAKQATEEKLAAAPNDPELHAMLGPILAFLGEHDAAIAESQRAVDLLPESKDAFDGPAMAEGLAQTHAVLGEAEKAVAILDHLLSRPSATSVQMLKLNPIWDRIRDHPLFQQLIQKYSARA